MQVRIQPIENCGMSPSSLPSSVTSVSLPSSFGYLHVHPGLSVVIPKDVVLFNEALPIRAKITNDSSKLVTQVRVATVSRIFYPKVKDKKLAWGIHSSFSPPLSPPSLRKCVVCNCSLTEQVKENRHNFKVSLEPGHQGAVSLVGFCVCPQQPSIVSSSLVQLHHFVKVRYSDFRLVPLPSPILLPSFSLHLSLLATFMLTSVVAGVSGLQQIFLVLWCLHHHAHHGFACSFQRTANN